MIGPSVGNVSDKHGEKGISSRDKEGVSVRSDVGLLVMSPLYGLLGATYAVYTALLQSTLLVDLSLGLLPV